jgi:group II intron reverse transcriptase/maturase
MNIGEMQRSLSWKADRDKKHRFDDLFNLTFHPEWLRQAHDRVAANAGSVTAGCDGIRMGDFDEDLEGNLRGLADSLRSGSFEASPVRRVYIPKANGKRRPLGIPSIRDRIVQEAVRMILEPIFEADFWQDSYGFRPNRCTMDAVAHLWPCLQKGYHWVIEGDISSYFDTIHHRKLTKRLKRRVADGRLLDLIWQFLRAGVVERGRFQGTELGTPQGGIISPLLANVYLHELDSYLEPLLRFSQVEKARRRRHGKANFAYARYADDFVILCNGTREQAYAMREEVNRFLAEKLRLTLSLEKTKVTHLEDGFDFLGFHFRWERTPGGEAMMTSVSEKGMARHLEFIKATTSLSSLNDSIGAKLIALHRGISGWCRYYQHTNKVGKQFHHLARVTFWRFARWLAAKQRKRLSRVLREYSVGQTLVVSGLSLTLHSRFKRIKYAKKPHKPNPYLTGEAVEREELLDDAPWIGSEDRPGRTDYRRTTLRRDHYRCQMCGRLATPEEAEVDHKRPYARFKRHEDADRPENLWTLCPPCHQVKGESDR